METLLFFLEKTSYIDVIVTQEKTFKNEISRKFY
jgi:hypothetical protein